MNNETEEFYAATRKESLQLEVRKTMGEDAKDNVWTGDDCPFDDGEMGDAVNHPSHYADGWSNGAEVIDITENLNFNRGNAVKYICRAGRKSKDTEAEDLRKAAWYINRELERMEGSRADGR